MTAPAAQKYWFHRHPKGTACVVAFLGCIIAIIAAELSARLLFPQWAPDREERVKFWAYDPLLGWAHTPNQRGRFTHRDFTVEVAINSKGMRDTEYPVERTEKKRMLVLGDSYAWGFGVEKQQRFSEVLNQAHPDWEIINASVSGYGTDQEFLFLQQRGIAFKPDLVLLLFYVNDFENNIHAEEYWHFKPLFVIESGQLKLQNVPVPRATVMQRFRRFFLGTTYLGSRLYYGTVALFRRAGLVMSEGKGNSDKNREDGQRMYNVTHRLITGMNELCRKNGSLLVLASVPMEREHRTFLQYIAEKEKTPYLPLDAHFESTTASVLLPHDEHWNAKGHEIAATAIDAFLRKLGVFDTPKSER